MEKNASLETTKRNIEDELERVCSHICRCSTEMLELIELNV